MLGGVGRKSGALFRSLPYAVSDPTLHLRPAGPPCMFRSENRIRAVTAVKEDAWHANRSVCLLRSQVQSKRPRSLLQRDDANLEGARLVHIKIEFRP